MADILDIGISGLKTHQTALTVTGHNIANVDTEGYSRQEANIVNATPNFQGGIWLGNGAFVDDVRRVYDEFLVRQLQKDTSTFNYFDTLATNAEAIDKLLADPGTGIQPGIENMFGSLQAAIDDPSSLPARQVVISESQGLVDRYQSIYSRLQDSNEIANGQLEVLTTQITTIAEAIAELNQQIQFATATAQGNRPNDLLDKRDLALKNLSELVGTTVVEQDNNAINVFIGNGQPLVVGNEFNVLTTQTGSDDPSRSSIVFIRNEIVQDVTNDVTGGQIGGILQYRGDVLDPVFNQLGRTAIALSANMNEQHQLGIDIDGLPGGLFFEDINEPKVARSRVIGNANNAQPNDRIISANITDPNQLTDSDYRVEFIGPNDFTFRVTRVKDGEEMFTSALSTNFPESFEVEGFDLTFEAGSFKAGDKFYVMPTRTGGNDIELDIELPQELALATAVMSDFDVGNIGSGVISPGTVYDSTTDAFSVPGELNPPLLIKFTSDTTYDVLDNTDPANPLPLFPPIMNQTYTPGVVNNMLPLNEGKTAVTTFGGYLAANPTYQDYTQPTVTPGNGLFPARITLSDPDPITGGFKDRGLISIPYETTAKGIADELNKQDGVLASARTTLQLSDFVKDSNEFIDTKLFLNGIELTDTLPVNQLKYEADYPDTVPEPLNANFIADRINANFDFQEQGIIARSDGAKVTIIALNGEDLSIEIQGDHDDGLSASNGQDTYVSSVGGRLAKPLSKYEGYDFSTGGPYQFEFTDPMQGTFSFTMSGTFATGADLLAEIESQITNSQFAYQGRLDVDIDEKGNIIFQQRMDLTADATNGSQKMTMGGQVKIVLDEGIQMRVEPPGSNLLPSDPEQKPVYFGYELTMEGIPKEGDQFFVDYNQDAVTDNRNGALLGAIQNKEIIEDDMTLSEGYGRMIEEVGSITARAQINQESSEVLLQNTQDSVDGVSGVNLDEEAAKLIQYELGYNASAQVISVARELFSTLIGIFR